MTVHQSLHNNSPQPDTGRRAAMAILAEAETAEIAAGLRAMPGVPDCTYIRVPETGLVMVRGRVGGDGAPFNLGEATVTRAAVRLASGEIGFAYVLGRDRTKARQIAICDALYQQPDQRPKLERHVLAPIRRRIAADRKISAERTAATRVDFFTLARGED